MGPPLYMQSVVDRNVVMRHMTVLKTDTIKHLLQIWFLNCIKKRTHFPEHKKLASLMSLLKSKTIQYQPVPCHRQQHLLHSRRKIYYTVAYLVLQIDFPLCQSWYEIQLLFHVQTVVAQIGHHSRGHDNMELLCATNTDIHH